MNDYIPTEDVEAPLSYTGKSNRGSLFTLRANDAAQFVARSIEAIESNVLEWVGKLDAELQEKTGSAAPSGSKASSSGSSGSSSGGSTSSSDTQLHPEGLKCPKCQGAVGYKEIKSKAGKTFKLWVCENQRERNDGHHSEFIN